MGGSDMNGFNTNKFLWPVEDLSSAIRLLETKLQNHRLIRIQLIYHWFPLISAQALVTYFG